MLELLAQSLGVVVGGGVDPGRQRLRADQVVRRQRRRQCPLARAGRVQQHQHVGLDERAQQHAAEGSIGIPRAHGQQAAHHGCHLREPRLGLLQRGVASAARAPGAALQGFLGFRDQLDHAVVGFARRVAPGDDAVLQPDHGSRLRLRLAGLRRAPREFDAGPQVGQHGDVVAQRLADPRLAVFLVGERQHGVGVRVIDEATRQEGVHRRLDGGAGGVRVAQAAAQRIENGLVVERLERAQAAQALEVQAHVSLGRDAVEVLARGLHEERVHGLAPARGAAVLDRRVAAAVQHQGGLGADQAAAVGALRQRAAALGRVALHAFLQ